MTSHRRHQIENLAKIILESLNSGLPIDPYKTINQLGGKLTMVPKLENDADARIQREGDGFEVQLASGKPAVRERFTVAHELGHLFVHMGYMVDPDKWAQTTEYNDSVYYRYGYGQEEVEANAFAAAFLMPESDFRHAVRDWESDPETILDKLADRFQVSTDAAKWRGVNLGLFGRE